MRRLLWRLSRPRYGGGYGRGYRGHGYRGYGYRGYGYGWGGPAVGVYVGPAYGPRCFDPVYGWYPCPYGYGYGYGYSP